MWERKLNITGLDELTRKLEGAQKALKLLDGELGSVSFDPDDPSSIQAAIKRIETMIDERVGSYADNPIISQLIDGMKEQYKQGILERAAAARLKKDGE